VWGRKERKQRKQRENNTAVLYQVLSLMTIPTPVCFAPYALLAAKDIEPG
jgi:hypothetical protein